MDKESFSESFKVCTKALAALVTVLMLWDVGLMCAVFRSCSSSMISTYAILIASIVPVSTILTFFYLLFVRYLLDARFLIPVALVSGATLIYFWWSEVLSYWPILVILFLIGVGRRHNTSHSGGQGADTPFVLSDEEIYDRKQFQKYQEKREQANQDQRDERETGGR